MDLNHIEKTKKRALQGSAIVFLLTVIAFPILQIRNWFLSHIGTDTEVAGIFALIILLQQGIPTFLLLGGRNVITTFYPKLKTNTQRAGFANLYYILVALATLIGICIILFWPRAIEIVFRKELNAQTVNLLLLLVPVVLLAQMGNSFLTAMQHFGLAAFFGRSQQFVMTIVIGLFYFLAPKLLEQNPLLTLGGTLFLLCLANVVIALSKMHKSIGISKSFFTPLNSVRFIIFAHLEKVFTFFYTAMDQVFVLVKFDVAKLGEYFIFLQLARIIPLSFQIFGHIILTTFSSLLGSNKEAYVVSTYRKLSRLSTALHFLIAAVLVLFARQIASLFGESCAENNRYLIWLAVNMNINSLHTIASMYSTSREKMSQLFYAKLGQITLQLITTVLLLNKLGVYSIIIGKGAGILVANIAVFIIAAHASQKSKVYPPAIFYISQTLLILMAVYTHIYQQNWIISAVIFTISAIIFALTGRYRTKEFTSIVKTALKKE